MKTLFSAFIIFIAIAANLSAQNKTIWLGYDRGIPEPLYTWDGHYMAKAFHCPTGTKYAQRFKLSDFGITQNQTDTIYAIRMNILVSAGVGSHFGTAYIGIVDTAGLPTNPPKFNWSWQIYHHANEMFDTTVVLNLNALARANLANVKDLYVIFDENADTTRGLFTFLRCGWLPWAPIRMYQQLPGRAWELISEPVIGGGIVANGTNIYWQLQIRGNLTATDRTTESTDFILHQNYPNPFNGMTNFSYSLSRAGKISLKIFDVYGREVANVIDGDQEPGTYTQPFVANLPAGMYYYRLATTTGMVTKRLIVTK